MRIGINALFMIPGAVGGTESYLRNLLRLLQEIDTENEYAVFTNEESYWTFDLRARNFEEIRCSVSAENRSERILWEQTVLPLALERRNIDVLHSPGYTAPLVMRAASVVTIHDMNYHYFPQDWSKAALWANRLLIPRVARRATRIITISQASKRAIVDILRIPEDRIDVVLHGADGNLVEPADEATVRAHFGLEGRYILSVSASHPHKNLDGLLRGYDLACRDWPSPPPLVIVGVKGRHQEEVEARLAARKGPGRIILTGWVDAPSLSALYRGAHLFVFPSKYEGFGLPPLEAMSVGVPVVSSNAASLAEVVADAGLKFDPADEKEMARLMRRAWDDEDLRRDLIARGHAHAATFTWRRSAEQTLESYQRAYWRRRRRPADVAAR